MKHQQGRKLDFFGKTIYCGADVHKASWAVCLIMEDRILKRFTQPPEVGALEKMLKRQYPGANFKVAYEAGFCGFRPQRLMTELGIDCMVVNAADVPTMNKEKQQKSDPIDCGKLARCLSAGMLSPIHIPSVQQQDDRCIVRNYLQFIKDQTRCKNRITGALYFQGITPGLLQQDGERTTYWSKNYIRWVKEVLNLKFYFPGQPVSVTQLNGT